MTRLSSNQYHYRFPRELVATKPARPRDAARLLVYSRMTKKVSFDVFHNIGRYLPPRSLIVLNQTKVIPARLTLVKTTGGRVRILYLGHDRRYVRVLADRELKHGQHLSLRGVQRRSNPDDEFLVVRHTRDGHYLLKPSFPTDRIVEVLYRFGTTPLPPYIKNSPLNEQAARREYQTVFARVPGSVAAPTAALHFTKPLLATLKRSGHEICFVTLHVNLGTFAPVTPMQLKTNRLHPEYFSVLRATRDAIVRAKREGRPVVAVGTTAVRALESASSPTTLFIRPGFRFKNVDGLITNFHVPGSSLLMLVAALTGRSRLISLYQQAIRRRFRLFSFGDAMLIL